MKRTSKPISRAAPKTPTTPEVASKVQSITAKVRGGTPAPWVGDLQRAADVKYGKSGAKPLEQTPKSPEPPAQRHVQLNPNHENYWKARGWSVRPDDWKPRIEVGNTMPGTHGK